MLDIGALIGAGLAAAPPAGPHTASFGSGGADAFGHCYRIAMEGYDETGSRAYAPGRDKLPEHPQTLDSADDNAITEVNAYQGNQSLAALLAAARLSGPEEPAPDMEVNGVVFSPGRKAQDELRDLFAQGLGLEGTGGFSIIWTSILPQDADIQTPEDLRNVIAYAAQKLREPAEDIQDVLPGFAQALYIALGSNWNPAPQTDAAPRVYIAAQVIPTAFPVLPPPDSSNPSALRQFAAMLFEQLNVTYVQVTQEQAPPEQVSLEQAPPEQTLPDTAPEVFEQVSPEQATPAQAAPEPIVPETATLEQVTPAQSAPDTAEPVDAHPVAVEAEALPPEAPTVLRTDEPEQIPAPPVQIVGGNAAETVRQTVSSPQSPAPPVRTDGGNAAEVTEVPETPEAAEEVVFTPSAAQPEDRESDAAPVAVKALKTETPESGETETDGTNMAIPVRVPAAPVPVESRTVGIAQRTSAPEIIDQVVRYLHEKQGETVTKLEMQLHPASLGKLSLLLERTREGVSVTLKSASDAVRQMLAGSLVDLESALKGAGVHMKDLRIEQPDIAWDMARNGQWQWQDDGSSASRQSGGGREPSSQHRAGHAVSRTAAKAAESHMAAFLYGAGVTQPPTADTSLDIRA